LLRKNSEIDIYQMKNCVMGDWRKLHNLSVSTVSGMRRCIQTWDWWDDRKEMEEKMCEILSSQSVKSKTVSWNIISCTQSPVFWGRDAVKFCRKVSTFQRNLVHLSYTHDGANSRSVQNVDTYLLGYISHFRRL
jgi:hypothetical protein